jgi:hypothetical protein
MPIPNALRSLIHDPAFWSDFFGEEIYFNDYSSLADPALAPARGREAVGCGVSWKKCTSW